MPPAEVPDERGIESAFLEVKSLVERLLRGGDVRREALEAIFKLNNEIGRRAVLDGSRARVTPLQQWVNAVTVAVKNSDVRMMAASLKSTEETLELLTKK